MPVLHTPIDYCVAPKNGLRNGLKTVCVNRALASLLGVQAPGGKSTRGVTSGVVLFTDPPILTWHRPIYFSYLAVVSGTLP